MSAKQLTLSVHLNDEATFDNFFAASNSELLTYLREIIGTPHHHFCYLWGANGVGKSHLLQACCLSILKSARSASYISLAEPGLQPEVLEGLEQFDLVGLDDLENVITDPEWQEALFHLYNRLRDNNTCLIVSANTPPKQLNCQLADLQSRLSWGTVYQVQGLSDNEKRQALQLRAQQRGLKLPTEVATFLLKRCPRNMNTLYQILEQLDHASLSMQRSLTIPFVKTVLGL